MTTPTERLLAKLPDAKKSGKGWSARCPAHEDRRASLSISEGDNGGVVLHCHAGCEPADIVAALGLTLADLMPPRTTTAGKPNVKPRIVMTYNYLDDNGELLFQVVRYEPKDFRQRRPKPGGGWDWSVKGVRVVPYNLSQLLSDPTRVVVVVEGEKDADNLARIGVLATCNAGGAGKWTPAHAEFLRDRHVIVLSDNDEPGRNHAQQVALTLHGVAASVRIVYLPGLSAKEDVSDWIEADGTKEELKRLAEAAPVWTPEVQPWPEPQPLPDLLPPVAPFTAGMLPDAVRSFVEDVAERMQCPIDFPAIAMMIVLAGVVGRKVAVRPKCRDDWTVVANLWGLAVGRPGLMKTPAINEPTKFLKRLEIDAKRAYDAELQEYQATEMVAKAARQNAEQEVKKALKDGADAAEIARRVFEQEQKPPTRRRYQVNDPTVEKLGEILNENPNGVTLCRDELYAFLRSLDKDGHEAARGFYLEAWNGNGRYCYDRIGRGTIDIDAAVVSMIGTIQPSRLAEYVCSAVRGGSGDDGLIQRFQLAVWPDCSSKWHNVDRWPDLVAKKQVFDLVSGLDELTADKAGAIQGEDDEFPYLRFAPDAQAVFDNWLTKLETRLRGDELVPAMESHLAKYRSLVPSLALLIHLADGGIAEISIPAIERAIAWGSYLESHAHRVYASTVHSDVVAARCLAKKITDGSLTDGFSVKDVYRPGWSGLSTREEAQTAIDLLVDLDWLAVVETPTTGRKRTEHRINPRIQQTAPGKELPKLPKGAFGGFGSTQGEGFPGAQSDDWGEL